MYQDFYFWPFEECFLELAMFLLFIYSFTSANYKASCFYLALLSWLKFGDAKVSAFCDDFFLSIYCVCSLFFPVGSLTAVDTVEMMAIFTKGRGNVVNHLVLYSPLAT
jgi:hypothetical protein